MAIFKIFALKCCMNVWAKIGHHFYRFLTVTCLQFCWLFLCFIVSCVFSHYYISFSGLYQFLHNSWVDVGASEDRAISFLRLSFPFQLEGLYLVFCIWLVPLCYQVRLVIFGVLKTIPRLCPATVRETGFTCSVMFFLFFTMVGVVVGHQCEVAFATSRRIATTTLAIPLSNAWRPYAPAVSLSVEDGSVSLLSEHRGYTLQWRRGWVNGRSQTVKWSCRWLDPRKHLTPWLLVRRDSTPEDVLWFRWFGCKGHMRRHAAECLAFQHLSWQCQPYEKTSHRVVAQVFRINFQEADQIAPWSIDRLCFISRHCLDDQLISIFVACETKTYSSFSS